MEFIQAFEDNFEFDKSKNFIALPCKLEVIN